MMEIFGDAVPAAPKAPVATAPAAAPKPVAAPVQTAPVSDDDGLSADEMALLEAYEKQKQEKRRREDEAKKKKEEDAKRILEEYERAQAEAKAKEERERKEREAKRQAELEELKKKEEFKLDAERLAEEERKIIEDFEREAAAQKIKQEEERKAKEAAAQAELQRLAEQQQAEAQKREAEEASKEAELQAQAQAQSVGKKDSRLLELLAKAQQDLQNNALPPLPGGGAAAPAPAAKAGPSASDVLLDIELKENEAFCLMLDETRKAMFTFLAPLIGIKAANNMLNKSVEKARTKAPIALKDANWRMDGSLRDDGSVDPERLLKNVANLPVATRVNDYLTGFHELVAIRIKAVEAGLGATTSGEMKNRVLATRDVIKTKPIDPRWVELFFTEVVG
jgi:actin-related protein